MFKGGKRQPLLARAEDSSADPSPKKHKTGATSSNNFSKRSRLEERFSNTELRYIDSGSPEQVSNIQIFLCKYITKYNKQIFNNLQIKFVAQKMTTTFILTQNINPPLECTLSRLFAMSV